MNHLFTIFYKKSLFFPLRADKNRLLNPVEFPNKMKKSDEINKSEQERYARFRSEYCHLKTLLNMQQSNFDFYARTVFFQYNLM